MFWHLFWLWMLKSVPEGKSRWFPFLTTGERGVFPRWERRMGDGVLLFACMLPENKKGAVKKLDVFNSPSEMSARIPAFFGAILVVFALCFSIF